MPSKSRLEKLAEEATVDANSLDEAHSGFLAVMEDRVGFPFPAKVVGEEVSVTGLDYDDARGILAVCRRKGHRYKVALVELEYKPRQVKGSEWLQAYRHWLGLGPLG